MESKPFDYYCELTFDTVPITEQHHAVAPYELALNEALFHAGSIWLVSEKYLNTKDLPLRILFSTEPGFLDEHFDCFWVDYQFPRIDNPSRDTRRVLRLLFEDHRKGGQGLTWAEIQEKAGGLNQSRIKEVFGAKRPNSKNQWVFEKIILGFGNTRSKKFRLHPRAFPLPY